MKYSIFLDKRVIDDIQHAIDFYEGASKGLGQKFESYLNKYISSLIKNPFFQIRYDQVHCLPLKKSPYMIHYTIKQNHIYIHAVIHTKLNPSKKWLK